MIPPATQAQLQKAKARAPPPWPGSASHGLPTFAAGGGPGSRYTSSASADLHTCDVAAEGLQAMWPFFTILNHSASI